MQNVTLSDPPADALAAIKARLRPRRIAWYAAAAPLVAGVLAFAVRQDGVGALLLIIGMAALLGLWLYCQLGGGGEGNEHSSPETLWCAPALKVFRPEPIWPFAGLTTS